MEVKLTVGLVEHIHRALKLALMAYETSFTKCKSLAKELFLEIDADLLVMAPSNDSELPKIVVSMIGGDDGEPS